MIMLSPQTCQTLFFTYASHEGSSPISLSSCPRHLSTFRHEHLNAYRTPEASSTSSRTVVLRHMSSYYLYLWRWFAGAVSCDPFMSLVGLMNGLPGDVGSTGTVATHDALYEQLWHNDLRPDPDTQTGTERRPQIHPHARMITDTRYLS